LAQFGDAGGFPRGELVLLGEPDTALSGVLDFNESALPADVFVSEGSGGAGGTATGVASCDI